MRARDFLLEYDQAKTLANFSERLKARIKQEWKEDSDFRSSSPPSDKDAAQHLGWIAKADPTSKKAYVLDLLRMYLDGSIQRFEDVFKATEPLTLYAKFRNRGLPSLRTMTFPELLDLGDELSEVMSQSETSKSEEQGFYDRDEAYLMRDTPEYKVIIPHTETAAQFFGRGTRWCTASANNNMFDRYYARGKIYIVLFKGQAKKWQIHCETTQFMDARDEQIGIDDWFAEGDFVEWFAQKVMKAQLPKHGTSLLRYYPNPDSLSTGEKLHQIGSNIWSFRFFIRPENIMIMKMVQSGKADTVKTIIASMPRNDMKTVAEKAAINDFGPTFYFVIEDPMWDTKEWFDNYLRNWFTNSVPMDHYDSILEQHPEMVRYAITNDLLSGDHEAALINSAKRNMPNALSAIYARDNKRKAGVNG